jgi:hypothetical protein
MRAAKFRSKVFWVASAMHLFEITHDESQPAYAELAVSNNNRQYDFLRSIVVAALAVQRPYISETLLKALNFHAIACLHINAGEFRPCPVSVGTYIPPEHFRVQALMDDFINQVNWAWSGADPVALAAFVLWRVNAIPPFINGNGRTARAASYYVLCAKLGGWLPGEVILPELLKRERAAYVAALKEADSRAPDGLAALHALMQRLLAEQLATSGGGAAN